VGDDSIGGREVAARSKRCEAGFARMSGCRPASGLIRDEPARLKQLEQEHFEPRGANEVLEKASACSHRRSSTAKRVMAAFIDDHRKIFGVEPICSVLPIGPDVLWASGAMGSGSAIGAGAARRGTPRDHSADLTSATGPGKSL
jgi:hypothetical protein